jgi:pyruvate formate lyase activating enzyme
VSALEAADALGVGGLQPFTTIDYPGALAAVVFVQGCAWRCGYCHNPHLQPRSAGAGPSWTELRSWLQRRRTLLDALVFSGGEPTLDPALPAAMREARALGYRIGLHSAGLAPQRLRALLPLVDWVGLDVKAPFDEHIDDALHDHVTGVRGAARAVRASVRALLASEVASECRTTVHASLLDDDALVRLSAQLRALGVRRWALQACREPTGASGRQGAVTWPDATTLAGLRRGFPEIVLRPAA